MGPGSTSPVPGLATQYESGALMDIRRENEIALIIAMMAMLLMTALGIALVMTTTSETLISSNFRNGGEGLYAADAAVERAMDDLLTVSDWNTILAGSVQS